MQKFEVTVELYTSVKVYKTICIYNFSILNNTSQTDLRAENQNGDTVFADNSNIHCYRIRETSFKLETGKR